MVILLPLHPECWVYGFSGLVAFFQEKVVEQGWLFCSHMVVQSFGPAWRVGGTPETFAFSFSSTSSFLSSLFSPSSSFIISPAIVHTVSNPSSAQYKGWHHSSSRGLAVDKEGKTRRLFQNTVIVEMA